MDSDSDAHANADADDDTRGSAIALPGLCPGELKSMTNERMEKPKAIYSHSFFKAGGITPVDYQCRAMAMHNARCFDLLFEIKTLDLVWLTPFMRDIGRWGRPNVF